MRAFKIILSALLIFFLAVPSSAQIYYTYSGKAVDKLYIGGELHVSKKIADRVRVTGGVLENETEEEWIIKVTGSTVVLEYVKLSNDSFSYAQKTFKAEEFNEEIYTPMKPDEIRIALNDLNNSISAMSSEISEIKERVYQPSFEERFREFLLYNPFMIFIYIVVAFFVILIILGRLWDA